MKNLSLQMLFANTSGKKAAAKRNFNKLPKRSQAAVKAHVTRYLNSGFRSSDWLKNVMGVTNEVVSTRKESR